MHFKVHSVQSENDPEIDLVLKKLLNRFFIIFLIAGTFSLAGSIVRVIHFGWMLQHGIHAAVYAALVLSFILFRKFSVKSLAIVLFSLTGIDAVANLYTFGLASTGTLMLGYTIIMVSTFVGFHAGVITLALSLGILTFFALGISMHWIPTYTEIDRYVSSWSTWVTQISTYIVMLSTAIVSTYSIKKKLQNSLSDLRERSRQLTVTNKSLLQSERKIGAIIKTAPEAIITTTLNGTISSCNEQACLLLDYASTDLLVGKEFFSHIAPDHLLTIREILSTCVEHNKPIRNIEFKLHTLKQKTIPVKMSANILHDENSTPAGYLAIIQDITRSKELEEHLRQSEKMEAIGQLAGGIAHDFNNQLTGIMGFAEILRCNLANDPENLEEITALIQTVEKATSLTGQLLSFSRKGINQSANFNLHETIFNVQQLLRRTIDPSIKVICETKAESATVHGDASQMQSALLNLSLNARDAMPSGGTLTITTSNRNASEVSSFYPLNIVRTPKPFIIISVKDTGCGMDEETQKRIFEPFFTTKPSGKGTGMGLANVYSTIKNHGGTIEVNSKPAHGTEMKLFLPVVSP